MCLQRGFHTYFIMIQERRILQPLSFLSLLSPFTMHYAHRDQLAPRFPVASTSLPQYRIPSVLLIPGLSCCYRACRRDVVFVTSPPTAVINAVFIFHLISLSRSEITWINKKHKTSAVFRAWFTIVDTHLLPQAEEASRQIGGHDFR